MHWIGKAVETYVNPDISMGSEPIGEIRIPTGPTPLNSGTPGRSTA